MRIDRSPALQPAATLSVDLDNLWCYQRSFGVAGWWEYPSFLERALPRLLEVLERLDLRLTAFVVGRDAERATMQPLLKQAAELGHEVGNHSYDHLPAMHGWSQERIRTDIVRADQVIQRAIGQQPRGFRGPAYGLSAQLLETLIELGYLYDASSYPNSLGSLARGFHRKQVTRLGGFAPVSEHLYGRLSDSRRPLRPYLWSLAGGVLAEVPVTTLPLLRLPFHGTYLNHLADFSPMLAAGYFRAALSLCRLRGVPPSFLLHATDVLGRDDCPGVDYLPGMRRTGAEKVAFMTTLLGTYRRAFHIQPIGAFLDGLSTVQRLPEIPAAAAL